MATYPYVRGDMSPMRISNGEGVLEGVVPRVVELGRVWRRHIVAPLVATASPRAGRRRPALASWTMPGRFLHR
jgi:hypothetical protein